MCEVNITTLVLGRLYLILCVAAIPSMCGIPQIYRCMIYHYYLIIVSTKRAIALVVFLLINNILGVNKPMM